VPAAGRRIGQASIRRAERTGLAGDLLVRLVGNAASGSPRPGAAGIAAVRLAAGRLAAPGTGATAGGAAGAAEGLPVLPAERGFVDPAGRRRVFGLSVGHGTCSR